MKIIDSKTAKKYAGKTALVRLGINADPKDSSSNFRFKSVLPTVELLVNAGVKVILIDHRGQPEKPDSNLSLKKFAKVFEHELKTKVLFLEKNILELNRGDFEGAKVFLLENIRFYKEETENNSNFAKQLSSLGDFYINEAFSGSHRAHASLSLIPNFLPSFAGLNFAEEIKNLSGIMKAPKKPVVLIIGGAKISDKLGVIKNFWNKADAVLLGGGPANTALEIFGFPMGKSITDSDARTEFKDLAFSPKIYVPQDLEVSTDRILDIGLKTTKEYTGIIAGAGTIIWNGPMGWFENKKFRKGTETIWKAILKNKKANIIVGGGETVASFSTLGFKHSKLGKNVFMSTGGGAMLHFLGGKKLPGLEALK